MAKLTGAIVIDQLKGILQSIQGYVDRSVSAVNEKVEDNSSSISSLKYAGSSSAGGAATSANKVINKLILKLNGGTTEGTNMFTFDGSGAKTVNITPSGIGAAASSHGTHVTADTVEAVLNASGVTAGSYGPSANTSPAHGKTFSVPYITVDAKGRVTGASTKTITLPSDNNTDTKNTAGSTDSSSKLFLIGATSQGANPQTYSHETAYVGTDGCLYSGGEKVATHTQGVYYIEGTGDTAGTWLGSHGGITEYYAGLMIAYKPSIAGASGLTLNINSLGAVPVVRNATTNVTTHYSVGSVVFLVYTVDSDGTAYWKVSDYDSDTKTRSSNKTGTKMYIIGAASQSTSGQTTYSNKNCYIGTDNCLYSGAKKTATVDQILTFSSLSVATSAWEADTTYSDYPYRAAITCSDVTADYAADVVYDVAEATGGNYAPVCRTGTDLVYIYAKSIPSAAITIPTIVARKAVS